MGNDTDIATAAESIRRMLELIDIGALQATTDERRRLEGALVALAALLPPARLIHLPGGAAEG